MVVGRSRDRRAVSADRTPAAGTVTTVRVALVAETFLPAVNGVVNSVLRTAEHLIDRGHDPVVIAPGRAPNRTTTVGLGGGGSLPTVHVPGVPLPGYPGLTVARPGLDLRATLAGLRPDVVHLASPLVLGHAAGRAARDLELPVVAAFQTDVSAFLRRYRLPATGTLWRRLRATHALADVTLSPSSACDYLLRRHGIGPLARWARGVDAALFSPDRRSEALRRTLTGGTGHRLVGYVGRLAPEKRVERLAAVSRLPGVTLVVVGDGPRRARLTQLMPDAVFVGQRQGADLARHMASLDLLVHPGADETFCQVVQEALACGVPVLAAAAGGPLDLVRHGDNGWLWGGTDVHLLASQVDAVLADARGLRAAGRRARSSVVHRSWASVGDDLLGVYGDVVAARTRPMADVRALTPAGVIRRDQRWRRRPA